MNLAKIGKNFYPSEDRLSSLKKIGKEIVETINEEIKKEGIDADVFIGGSFAKGTLVKKDKYDIDIFVRFGWKYVELSGILEKIARKTAKKFGFVLDRIHGSRDYFSLRGEGDAIFELIPVTRIKKPQESRNVTDLSYFHVNYVKKRLGKNLGMEVVLAKKFCEAAGVYGAESYIKGFSGYGLECLVIYYGGFKKMLRALSKVGDRIVIDPEKKYKKKTDVFFEMNEARLRSPIVLVDPTWKERNVLAALSFESFKNFQGVAKKFLRQPSEKYFHIERKKPSNKISGEIVEMNIFTDRQEGDIAGTKMKKFFDFVGNEIGKYFVIKEKLFDYNGEKMASGYLVLKSKGSVTKSGPPLKMKKSVLDFKRKNKKFFEKGGVLYSEIKVDFTGKEFLEKWLLKNKAKIKEMGIVNVKIV